MPPCDERAVRFSNKIRNFAIIFASLSPFQLCMNLTTFDDGFESQFLCTVYQMTIAGETTGVGEVEQAPRTCNCY